MHNLFFTLTKTLESDLCSVSLNQNCGKLLPTLRTTFLDIWEKAQWLTVMVRHHYHIHTHIHIHICTHTLGVLTI